MSAPSSRIGSPDLKDYEIVSPHRSKSASPIPDPVDYRGREIIQITPLNPNQINVDDLETSPAVSPSHNLARSLPMSPHSVNSVIDPESVEIAHEVLENRDLKNRCTDLQGQLNSANQECDRLLKKITESEKDLDTYIHLIIARERDSLLKPAESIYTSLFELGVFVTVSMVTFSINPILAFPVVTKGLDYLSTQPTLTAAKKKADALYSLKHYIRVHKKEFDANPKVFLEDAIKKFKEESVKY